MSISDQLALAEPLLPTSFNGFAARVTIPAVHTAHDTVGNAEYRPGPHSVQVDAPWLTTPVPTPSSVIEPAIHFAHKAPDIANVPASHAVHAMVGAMLDCPAGHDVQSVAPWITTVGTPIGEECVIEPAAHAAHANSADFEYIPAPHVVHVEAPLLTIPVPTPASAMDPPGHGVHATVGETEYMPAAHGVHVVALRLTTPVPAPTSVTDPAGHDVQDVVGAAEYMPAAHAVHVEALLLTTPRPAPASVIEPAVQGMHDGLPTDENRPIAQGVHAIVGDAEKRPAAQGLHVVAPWLTMPVPIFFSSIEPGGHVEQGDHSCSIRAL